MSERLIELLTKYDNFPKPTPTPSKPVEKPSELTKTEIKSRQINKNCQKWWGLTMEDVNNSRLVWFYEEELRVLSNPETPRAKYRYSQGTFLPSKTARKFQEIGLLRPKKPTTRVNLELMEHYLRMPCVTECYDPNYNDEH